MSKEKGTIYLIYDSRRFYNENEGIVFEVCETFYEAQESAPDYGEGCVIVKAKTEGNKIVSEEIIDT